MSRNCVLCARPSLHIISFHLRPVKSTDDCCCDVAAADTYVNQRRKYFCVENMCIRRTFVGFIWMLPFFQFLRLLLHTIHTLLQPSSSSAKSSYRLWLLCFTEVSMNIVCVRSLFPLFRLRVHCMYVTDNPTCLLALKKVYMCVFFSSPTRWAQRDIQSSSRTGSTE